MGRKMGGVTGEPTGPVMGGATGGTMFVSAEMLGAALGPPVDAPADKIGAATGGTTGEVTGRDKAMGGDTGGTTGNETGVAIGGAMVCSSVMLGAALGPEAVVSCIARPTAMAKRQADKRRTRLFEETIMLLDILCGREGNRNEFRDLRCRRRFVWSNSKSSAKSDLLLGMDRPKVLICWHIISVSRKASQD